jgi:hypothetical protein
MTAVLVGCQDLSVENTNSPDREQVLASAQDVENIAGNTFRNFWEATQWCDNSMMYSTLAGSHSCSWANWAMADMSSEPRIAWNNSSAYSRAPSTEEPWFDHYVAISNAADVLSSIERIGPDAINSELGDGSVAKIQATVNFVLGLSYGDLAARFDRAFLVDETTDLNAVAAGTADLQLQPYQEVNQFAISKLDKAINIASSSDFTITASEDWIFGLDVSSDRLVRLAKSYKARYLATVARTPEERQQVNWQEVYTLANEGITETFAPIGDDDGSTEWDCMKFYGQLPGTWSRADYRTIGPADQSGGYEDWLDTPVADRNPYLTETADRRIQGPGGPETDGKDYTFEGTAFTAFPPARGTYHYSDRTPSMYRDYANNNANGPMPVMEIHEMDLLKAEAILQSGGSIGGGLQEAADLINNSRVDRGELDPATADVPVGSIDDAPNPLEPGDVTLWSMMKYEFNIETALTASGLNYYTDRAWGDLEEGTPLHFPVPGAELNTVGLDNYTFGGVGGPCSAGNPTGCIGQPGGGGSSSLAKHAAESQGDIVEMWSRHKDADRVTLPSGPK